MLYDYYSNIKVIETNKRQSEKLRERLEKIKNDYSEANSNFLLDTDLKAVKYDRISVSGGSLPASSMDRQVDIIFSRIEEEKESINKQLLLINILIRKLEGENDLIEQLLGLLNEESKELIQLKFQSRLSYKQIAYKTSISEGNISKKLKKVKRDLIKWLKYQQEKNNGNKTAQNVRKSDVNGNFFIKNYGNILIWSSGTRQSKALYKEWLLVIPFFYAILSKVYFLKKGQVRKWTKRNVKNVCGRLLRERTESCVCFLTVSMKINRRRRKRKIEWKTNIIDLFCCYVTYYSNIDNKRKQQGRIFCRE